MMIIYSINQYQQNNILASLFDDTIDILDVNFSENVLERGFALSQSEQIKIENCQFSDNKSQNGGAISFLGIQEKVQFINSLFKKNQAVSSGGAFLFVDIAMIGGGLRIIINITNFLQIPNTFPFYQNVYQNQAEIYGNDATTYPQQLVIQNANNNYQQNSYQFKFYESQNNIPQMYQQEYSRYVDIKEFQSGGQLDLRIYILDNYNRYISFQLDKLLQSQYPIEVQEELKNIQISVNNLNIEATQLIGERIIDYNQYNSSGLVFELTGLKCQLGEIIQQITKKIVICKYCSETTYSLNDPEALYDQSLKYGIKNQCNNCPSSALQCYGQFIMLKNGYWRSNNLTDEIVACDIQIDSCQAENPNNIDYCSVGYLGPLCQQCDTTGAIWKGTRYQESMIQGVCKECAKLGHIIIM
ncbi:transmembrane protein, putative (macronuclear) [Tetrahymena thermophila SB210]|uniref:Transmembrane protein, putative n=1 Tax=Tetrahymena thermophila (strain SB210) TaxID=312017 RepID=Q22PB1_TETTS|nr:transmembrane protein, putative [Tetrahymena thermophila SB210]EAR87198.2 transmembrane protein, putative [Tetrahymena thermophila SB210]|eukprot:XP_001007443.2 transmembrane protein, putative [Tetrahymena thermophila SB210]